MYKDANEDRNNLKIRTLICELHTQHGMWYMGLD